MTMHWKDLKKDAKVTAIQQVYEPGLSATDIAKRIPGATKGAVVSVYRQYQHLLVNTPLRESDIDKSRQSQAGKIVHGNKRQTAEYFPNVAPYKPSEYDLTEARRVIFSEVKAGECQWAVNDAAPGEPHLFCGMPVSETDRSYCEHHRQRSRTSYIPPSLRF